MSAYEFCTGVTNGSDDSCVVVGSVNLFNDRTGCFLLILTIISQYLVFTEVLDDTTPKAGTCSFGQMQKQSEVLLQEVQ